MVVVPETLWQEFLKIIREEVGSRVVETWFKAIKCSHWDFLHKKVYLQAPNQFVRDWVHKNYQELCGKNLARLLNEQSVSIIFIQNDDDIKTTHAQKEELLQSSLYKPARIAKSEEHKTSEQTLSTYIPQKHTSLVKQTKSKDALNELYQFENFIVGPNNTLAFSAAQAVTENPGTLYNPLFIYGSSGLGKTHLLHAIGNGIKQRFKKATILYQSADRFVHEFIAAIRLNKVYQFEAKYKDVDVLLIDDIQFISNKEQTQEIFFHIFNMLHQAQKQIVFTSDAMPRDIAGLAQRMRSRLEGGLLADITMPTLETMVAILQKKGESFGQQVPDDVADFIASRGCCNVRELEGMLMRVIASASLNHETISFEIAERALSIPHESSRNKKISLHDIANLTAKHFGYSLQDLRSAQRNQDIVQARHVAVYLMKQMTPFSLREIAKFLERKDHSTIMHACEKITQRMTCEPIFARRINELQHSLLK